jgi:uncharacterized protein GlcG (DUF336 family)
MNDTPLTLKQAIDIAQAAVDAGATAGFAPLCVVVLDAGGNVLALHRDERASIYRPHIALAKASGCLGMGFGGRELAKRAQAMPQFFSALGNIFPNGIAPVAGGVLLKDGNGRICGAVGVSGDTSDNDEICALAGIASAGLIADTGELPGQDR